MSTPFTGPIPTPTVPAPDIVRCAYLELVVTDLEKSRAFYVDLMGFDVVFEARDVPGWGTTGDILFVSAGGYHHHLGFNTWKSAGGAPQPDGGGETGCAVRMFQNVSQPALCRPRLAPPPQRHTRVPRPQSISVKRFSYGVSL